MVDFGGLADKAKDLAAEHSDKIKDGVEKVGDFVGNKIGHDKVDPIEDKIGGFLDNLKGNDTPDATPDAPAAAPVNPPVVPPATATPPAV